jgi:hypothetical protein
MAEGPTSYCQYFHTVVRRALTPFAWTRDLLIATGVAGGTLAFQAYKNMIPDWHEHHWLWITSYVLPYFAVGCAHLVWRFAMAPWQVHQELESKSDGIQQALSRDLLASQNQNALLTERISNQTLPENRPRITIDSWGREVTAHGTLKPEVGLYLTNHGDAALEITLDEFRVGETVWVGESLSSIEQKQKSFLLIQEKGNTSSVGRWITSTKNGESRLRLKYRDFNNNWYQTTALITFVGQDVKVSSSTQEKLGSS